ncbi:ATP-binding protein [Nocardiopsis sp. CNT-189]|uniref:MacS family sensor histidine kinase n=1 Tax=Nocardiopsis oceanisediminis TaxID=2816862 RepID=UPI003B37C79D
MGFEAAVWRAIAVFRAASLAYAFYQVFTHRELLLHPLGAAAVLAVMAAWTGFAGYAYGRGRFAERRLAAADVAIAFGCMAATYAVVEPGYLRMAPPLTTTWFAGAALASAVVGGRRWALCVALGHGVADIAGRVLLGLDITAAVPRGVVLLLLAGYSMGYLAHYALRAERRLAEAVAIEARTSERERLARSIHDSVLQVLAMVSRRGAEIGGEAAELGRLAGEQEVRLRTLISSGPAARPPGMEGAAPPAGGRVPVRPGGGGGAPGGAGDLRAALAGYESARVTFSAPADPVPLPADAVEEIAAAVGAVLANVERHCPPETRAWLLLEDEGEAVTVTVRDDGPGMPPTRPAEAEAQGRLGLAQSVLGRIRDLGGETEITTAPGEGTEVEMRVPLSPDTRG